MTISISVKLFIKVINNFIYDNTIPKSCIKKIKIYTYNINVKSLKKSK